MAYRVALVIVLRGVLVKPEAQEVPRCGSRPGVRTVRADTDDIMRRLGYEETTIATYHAAGIA